MCPSYVISLIMMRRGGSPEILVRVSGPPVARIDQQRFLQWVSPTDVVTSQLSSAVNTPAVPQGRTGSSRVVPAAIGSPTERVIKSASRSFEVKTICFTLPDGSNETNGKEGQRRQATP
jgi:hypothetical protein